MRNTPCTQTESERYSTSVLKAGKATLTIYQTNQKKNLCILSTIDQTVSIDNSEKKLPETTTTALNLDLMLWIK